MAGTDLSSRQIISGINVTPLVDITLVLLIIFLVTAKIVVTPAVPIDLPQASHGEAVQVVFSLVVTAEGRLFADGAPLNTDEALIARAREALIDDPDLRVVIQADGATPHRRIIHVIDLLKSAGIARIAFGALPAADLSNLEKVNGSPG